MSGLFKRFEAGDCLLKALFDGQIDRACCARTVVPSFSGRLFD
jgi:hypothetical protein